ncbi:MAG: hypothetical protein LUF90_07615 [Rikenellaceae bacterium]|nr:hypothetical protein [Rikenellaceae bacterium]
MKKYITAEYDGKNSNSEFIELVNIEDIDTECLISYETYDSRFGKLMIGSIGDSICYVGFVTIELSAESELKKKISENIV